MVKPINELLESLKHKIGEDTSDETLELIENVSDTLNDLNAKATDTTNWQEKYNENDKAWREKYRDRFFNSEANDEPELNEPTESSIVKFEDLFKEE